MRVIRRGEGNENLTSRGQGSGIGSFDEMMKGYRGLIMPERGYGVTILGIRGEVDSGSSLPSSLEVGLWSTVYCMLTATCCQGKGNRRDVN